MRSPSSAADVSRRTSVRVARISCTAPARSVVSSPWPRPTDAAATLDIRDPAACRFIRRPEPTGRRLVTGGVWEATVGDHSPVTENTEPALDGGAAAFD